MSWQQLQANHQIQTHSTDYDSAQVVTETEAKELVEKAEEFRTLIEQWIAQHHAQFTP